MNVKFSKYVLYFLFFFFVPCDKHIYNQFEDICHNTGCLGLLYLYGNNIDIDKHSYIWSPSLLQYIEFRKNDISKILTKNLNKIQQDYNNYVNEKEIEKINKNVRNEKLYEGLQTLLAGKDDNTQISVEELKALCAQQLINNDNNNNNNSNNNNNNNSNNNNININEEKELIDDMDIDTQ